MNFVKRVAIYLLMSTPLFAAAVFSSWSALRGVVAALTLYKLEHPQATAGIVSSTHALKRSIQRHFSEYDIYIPFDDMMIVSEAGESIVDQAGQRPVVPGSELSASLAALAKRQAEMVKKVCGPGKIYVWVPLEFRLPIIGQKVVEWCFKVKSA